ncbi:uncharacterized protein BKA78DRAFT_28847 [Phyllosticta capitalensis]|uniref:uncharacterized protein n=1 Tax=Phyllosticta capitalensis TaxID=121624 RepID=UPI003130B7A1
MIDRLQTAKSLRAPKPAQAGSQRAFQRQEAAETPCESKQAPAKNVPHAPQTQLDARQRTPHATSNESVAWYRYLPVTTMARWRRRNPVGLVQLSPTSPQSHGDMST